MLYSHWEGYALNFRRDYIKTAKEGKGRVIWCISPVVERENLPCEKKKELA